MDRKVLLLYSIAGLLGLLSAATVFAAEATKTKVRLSLLAAMEAIDEAENGKKVSQSMGGDDGKASRWKQLNSSELGITNSMIPRTTRVVLNGLKRKGFEVYLVGGCVRDFILKRTPKDFDIITSAELQQIDIRPLRKINL